MPTKNREEELTAALADLWAMFCRYVPSGYRQDVILAQYPIIKEVADRGN